MITSIAFAASKASAAFFSALSSSSSASLLWILKY